MLNGIFVKFFKGARPLGVDFWAFILKCQIDAKNVDFTLEMWFNKIDKVIVNLKHAHCARELVWELDLGEPNLPNIF